MTSMAGGDRRIHGVGLDELAQRLWEAARLHAFTWRQGSAAARFGATDGLEPDHR